MDDLLPFDDFLCPGRTVKHSARLRKRKEFAGRATFEGSYSVYTRATIPQEPDYFHLLFLWAVKWQHLWTPLILSDVLLRVVARKERAKERTNEATDQPTERRSNERATRMCSSEAEPGRFNLFSLDNFQDSLWLALPLSREAAFDSCHLDCKSPETPLREYNAVKRRVAREDRTLRIGIFLSRSSYACLRFLSKGKNTLNAGALSTFDSQSESHGRATY